MSQCRTGLLLAGLAVAAGGLFAACNPELRLVTPPPPDSVGSDTTGTMPRDTSGRDTTGGNVQRAALVVTARAVAQSSSDVPLFQDLGWSQGPLADGQVEASRRGSSDQVAGVTDSAGEVRFTDLLPGTWDVSVLRLLTAEERARLRPELKDVTGFAGGGVVTLRAPERTVALNASAGRRGSLVISEIYFSWPFINDNSYVNATYLELYNNADTTIYLDGKLVGFGPLWLRDFGQGARGFFPCSLTVQWQTDSAGLWSPNLIRLPGTGTQYPLAPGTAAVIATDAIDHSAVDSRLPNLANARFESVGSADVDNPAVPNTMTIVEEFLSFLGRGMIFRLDLGAIFFVADTVDLTTVPFMRPGNYNNSIPRIPRERILDVFTSIAARSISDPLGGDEKYCAQSISPVFDLQRGRFNDGEGYYSIARKSLGLFGGQILLQRTKTSARDFERIDSLTPGRVR